MTIAQPTSSTRPSTRVLVPLGCLVAVAAGASYVVGTRHPAMHYEEAGCLSTETQVSCELEDWTIAVPTDIPWTGVDGSFRDGGRPECLPPTGRGEVGPVGLAWVPVEVDGVGWRSVVAVTCLS